MIFSLAPSSPPPSVMEFREHGRVVEIEQVCSVKITFEVLWYDTRSESCEPGHLITLNALLLCWGIKKKRGCVL